MADAFGDEVDAEHTITIGDYLKAVEEEELEADLVLGGDEGKECTYGKGYMKRQAVFSCLTCTPKGDAGVCTACSLSCHEGHEIVELWTKRNFRCDCGNSKFREFYCKLLASKDVENSQNSYNHNFKGTYCTCDLPYPDPNAEEQVEMIQCCICEDWFHEEHIGLQSSDQIPRDEEGEPLYEDLICQGCAVACSFLAWYPQTILAPDPSDMKEKIDLESSDPMPVDLEKGKSCIDASLRNTSSTIVPVETDAECVLEKHNAVGGSSTKCILGDLVTDADSALTWDNKPLFLSKNWRSALCICEKCSNSYAEKGLSFLLDKDDSIAEYEIMAKQKRDENKQKQESAGLNFLNNLGHVEKIEFISGIADLKNEICSFLESSDPSKVVTAADIRQVFENLAKKRKRLD